MNGLFVVGTVYGIAAVVFPFIYKVNIERFSDEIKGDSKHYSDGFRVSRNHTDGFSLGVVALFGVSSLVFIALSQLYSYTDSWLIPVLTNLPPLVAIFLTSLRLFVANYKNSRGIGITPSARRGAFFPFYIVAMTPVFWTPVSLLLIEFLGLVANVPIFFFLVFYPVLLTTLMFTIGKLFEKIP